MKNNGKVHFQIRFWRGETPVGSSASLLGLAPPWRHAFVSGSHLDPKMTGNSGSGAVRAGKRRALSLAVVVPTYINKYQMRYVGLGRDNLRSHFVFWPCHAPSDFVLDSSRSSFSQTKKN